MLKICEEKIVIIVNVRVRLLLSTKAEKAKKHGIEISSETDFLKMIGEM